MVEVPDRFEIAARTWAANDGIARAVRRLVESYDLDPALAEAVEDASSTDDREAMYVALADFLEALQETTA